MSSIESEQKYDCSATETTTSSTSAPDNAAGTVEGLRSKTSGLHSHAGPVLNAANGMTPLPDRVEVHSTTTVTTTLSTQPIVDPCIGRKALEILQQKDENGRTALLRLAVGLTISDAQIEALATLSPRQVEGLLNERGNLGQRPLHVAALNGHAGSFRELLAMLSPEQVTDQLTARDHNGDTPLNFIGNNPRALKELLSGLNEDQRRTVLRALLDRKDQNGVSVLHGALATDRASEIRACAAVVSNLVPIDADVSKILPRIVQAMDRGLTTPGFHVALGLDHADAIRAYGEVLQALPPDVDVVELLLAQDKITGALGPSTAIRHGKAVAVKAFGDVLKVLAGQVPPAGVLSRLLIEKNHDDKPDLLDALESAESESGSAVENAKKRLADVQNKMTDGRTTFNEFMGRLQAQQRRTLDELGNAHAMAWQVREAVAACKGLLTTHLSAPELARIRTDYPSLGL